MLVRLRASAVVLVAATALATASAVAAAVQPPTHRFVKGEHFRYSNAVTVGLSGEDAVISDDGPKTLTAVEEVRVVDVSASEATLAHHVELDKALDSAKASDIATGTTETTSIRAARDGTWRDPSGRIAENFVTWDPVQLGTQLAALTVGQHWTVNVPRTVSSARPHDVVHVVAVEPQKLALHVERAPLRFPNGTVRGTSSWTADIVFEHGIARDLHQVVVQRIDRGAGIRGVDARYDRRLRLVSHIVP